ncbi:endonuclease V [Acinetobacter higginsii]|uniref:endonuclease V n=1 Tax=Acinetobacter higginsii TaxID=70347 RepID=UPI001F4B4540|nr:endonuclease V [Acinetobacter higginsii]MCH7295377.1 endonuclease V [Acinetobacter higginsii]
MILAIDVHYKENSAFIAGVIFPVWESTTPKQIYTKHIHPIAEYESGNFYKRELPCILALLHDIHDPIDYIIIDGYVTLGHEGNAGLGSHLWQNLIPKIPVIGVAKNYFKDTPKACELIRGKSLKPLYITSIGIDLEQAKQYIMRMSGQHRIPNLLKLVDQESRAFF